MTDLTTRAEALAEYSAEELLGKFTISDLRDEIERRITAEKHQLARAQAEFMRRRTIKNAVPSARIALRQAEEELDRRRQILAIYKADSGILANPTEIQKGRISIELAEEAVEVASRDLERAERAVAALEKVS